MQDEFDFIVAVWVAGYVAIMLDYLAQAEFGWSLTQLRGWACLTAVLIALVTHAARSAASAVSLVSVAELADGLFARVCRNAFQHKGGPVAQQILACFALWPQARCFARRGNAPPRRVTPSQQWLDRPVFAQEPAS